MKMSKTIAVFSAVVMAMSATVTLNQSVSAGEDFGSYADEVVSLVNAERASVGLQPLEAVPVLNDVATMRSQEITRSFSHTRPDGRNCATALDDYGVKWMTSGENIAYGYDSPESVVNGWMNSEGHRANILNQNFEYIGVGVVEYGGLLYWTQTFTGGSQFDNAYTPETVAPVQNDSPCVGENCQPVTASPSAPCVGENCNPVYNSSLCVGENCIPFTFTSDCVGGNCPASVFASLSNCLKNSPACFTLPACGNDSGQCPLNQLAGLFSCH